MRTSLLSGKTSFPLTTQKLCSACVGAAGETDLRAHRCRQFVARVLAITRYNATSSLWCVGVRACVCAVVVAVVVVVVFVVFAPAEAPPSPRQRLRPPPAPDASDARSGFSGHWLRRCVDRQRAIMENCGLQELARVPCGGV